MRISRRVLRAWSSSRGALSTYVATAIVLPLLVGTTLAGSAVLKLTGTQARVNTLASVVATAATAGDPPTLEAIRHDAALQGLDPSRLTLTSQPVATPPGYMLLVISYRPSLAPFLSSVLAVAPTADLTASTLVSGQP